MKMQLDKQSGIQTMWQTIMFALIPGILAFLLYLPTLKHEFVYDDILILQNDPYPHNSHNILDILTLRILSRDMMDWNRPLNVLSTMIDSVFWGKNPVGYHLTNNLMHSLASILVFLLLMDVFRRAWAVYRVKSIVAALAGAILFAIHPLNCEAVAPVTFREDLMVCIFLLSTILTTRLFQSDHPQRRWFGIAAICVLQLLAITTKESGLLTPVVLTLYWWMFRRGEPQLPWKISIVAGILLALVFTGISVLLRYKGVSAVYPGDPKILGGSIHEMVLIAPSIWFLQLKHIILPLGLHPAYGSYDLGYSPYLIAIPVLALVVTGCIFLARKSRIATFALIFSCIMYAPTSNLMPLFQPLADRFMYVPLVGIAVLFGLLIGTIYGKMTKTWNRIILFGSLLTVFVIFTILTAQKIKIWHDEVSLWTYVVNRGSTSIDDLANLALGYLGKEDYRNALKAFNLVIDNADNTDSKVFVGKALCAYALGDLMNAKDAYHHAITKNPAFKTPHDLLPTLRWTVKQVDCMEQILKIP